MKTVKQTYTRGMITVARRLGLPEITAIIDAFGADIESITIEVEYRRDRSEGQLELCVEHES